MSQITTESKEADGSYDPLSVPAIATLTDKHVEETVRALKDSSIVRDAWKEGRELSIYGWVYHVSEFAKKQMNHHERSTFAADVQVCTGS